MIHIFRKKSAADSQSEAVRRSLRIMARLMVVMGDGDVVIRRSDGKEKLLFIV